MPRKRPGGRIRGEPESHLFSGELSAGEPESDVFASGG